MAEFSYETILRKGNCVLVDDKAGRLYGSCPDNWKNQRCSFSQQHRYEYDNSTVIK